MCISINLLCVGFCVYGFVFVFFAGILLSKFCSISPVLVRCCVWPRDLFFTFAAALTVFAGCIGNTASLGACLLCFH